MYYVYLLYSLRLDEFYLGYSSDLKKRIWQHQSGKNKSTKQTDDWILAYYEAYLTESLARSRESKLKRSGKAYVSLKERVRKSIK